MTVMACLVYRRINHNAYTRRAPPSGQVSNHRQQRRCAHLGHFSPLSVRDSINLSAVWLQFSQSAYLRNTKQCTQLLIITIIKTTSNVSVTVTVTVGVVDTRYGVSQPGADAER